MNQEAGNGRLSEASACAWLHGGSFSAWKSNGKEGRGAGLVLLKGCVSVWHGTASEVGLGGLMPGLQTPGPRATVYPAACPLAQGCSSRGSLSPGFHKILKETWVSVLAVVLFGGWKGPREACSQFSTAIGNNLFFVSSSAAHRPNGRLIRCQCRKQTAFTHLITTAEIFQPYCGAGGILHPSLSCPWVSCSCQSTVSVTGAGLGMAKEGKAGASAWSGGYGGWPHSSPGSPAP